MVVYLLYVWHPVMASPRENVYASPYRLSSSGGVSTTYKLLLHVAVESNVSKHGSLQSDCLSSIPTLDKLINLSGPRFPHL